MKKRSLLRYKLPFFVATLAMTSPATHGAPSFLRGSLGTLLTGLTCLVMQGRPGNASYSYFVNRSKELMDQRMGNDIIPTSDGNLLVAQLYEEDESVGFQKFDRDGTSLWLVNVQGTDLQSVAETSRGNYIGVGTTQKQFTVPTVGFCGITPCTKTTTSDVVAIIFLTPPDISGTLLPVAQVTSYRAFGSVAGHKGEKLIKLRGGDYIVVGTNLSPNLAGVFVTTGGDIALARITETGSKVWLNRYFVNPSVFAFGGGPSSDYTADKFFIVGQHDASFFVGKVDADATTAGTDVQFDFKRSVGIVTGTVFLGSLRAHDVLETVDESRLIVVGKHTQCCVVKKVGGYNVAQNYERLFIAQLDDSGDMEVLKTLVSQSGEIYDFSTAAWSVKENSQGGFLITGEYESHETGDTRALLMQVDTNLNLAFVHVYKEGAKNTGRSCLLTSDGRVYVTGSTTDPESGTPTKPTTFIGQWTSDGEGCGTERTSYFTLEAQPWQSDIPGGGNPSISYIGDTPTGDAEEVLEYVSFTTSYHIGPKFLTLDEQKNACVGNTDEPTRSPTIRPTGRAPQVSPRPTKVPTKSGGHSPYPFTLTAFLLPVALTLQLLRG